MDKQAGKVIIHPGAKAGRINAGIDLRGLDPAQAAAQIDSLAFWKFVGGAVDVAGEAGDINAGLQISFRAASGTEAGSALRQDLEWIREALEALAEDEAAPSELKEGALEAAKELADASAEIDKPKPMGVRIQGRIKSAADMLEQVVKSAEAGKKLGEMAGPAWTVLRENWPKLLVLAELAQRLPLPGK